MIELPKNFDERKAYLIKENFNMNLLTDSLIRNIHYRTLMPNFNHNGRFTSVASYPSGYKFDTNEIFVIYKADTILRGVTLDIKDQIRESQINKIVNG